MHNKFIYWEMLEEPIDICLFGGEYLLKNNIDLFNVTFKRDEDYRIIAILNGFMGQYAIGNKINDFFTSFEVNKIIIKSLNDGNDISFLYNVKNYKFNQIYYTVELDILSFELGGVDGENVAWKSRWYINGSDLFLLKNPKYNLESNLNYKCLNDEKDFVINTSDEFNHPISSYFIVEPETINPFIVSKISSKFNPEWSGKMCIDFFSKCGFPNKDEIKLIENLLSFVFGRSLIDIGESHFDKSGNLIYFKAYSPKISYTLNLKHICEMGPNCPIFYQIFEMRHEKDVAFLIDKCYANNVNYSNVFTYLRESFNSASLSEIVLIAGALEFLAEEWLENNSNGKHEHLPREDFENLISDELDSCYQKFEDYGIEKIEDLMDNIGGAYKKLGSKKLDLFFEELNIPIGKLEESAKYYRHFPAHGKVINLKTARKFSLRTISYRLLLNRCILKSLNFNGNYWDFFSKSYKNLDEPIDKNDFKEIFDSVKFIDEI